MISYIKNTLCAALIVFAGVISTACSHDVEMNYENVQIHFSIVTDPLLHSRAIGSVDDSIAEKTTVENLNLYIWNDHFSYNKYINSPSAFAINMIPGHYNVVAIGNAGKDLGPLDLSTLSDATLSDLGIDAYSQPIMTFTDEVDIAQGAEIVISLKRTYAYVAFNFSIASSLPDCMLLSYRLHNIPSTTTLAAPASGKYTDSALCTAMTEYYTLSGTAASDKTYVFENCQPDVPSITDEKDRTRDNAPASATYMELRCQYFDGRIFTLRFYLGDGSPSSFTLKRNTRTQYNITIYSEKDARVTTTEAEYRAIMRQIITAGTGAGYYDLGTVSYLATDGRELDGNCVSVLDVGRQLESKGGVLQVYKNGAWVDVKSSDAVTIPAANISGTTATMKYRAYIPALYLSAASTLDQDHYAQYMVAENQYETLATTYASTRFGYKATLRSSSAKATFTLKAEAAASGWVDATDPEKNICIETAAANKNAIYAVQGTSDLIKNFAGLFDDQTGAAVGRVTSRTTTSVIGVFPVTQTASYTLRFSTASISISETNQNQTYMLNRNTITVRDSESHPTLTVTLQCKDGDGIFLRNATYDSKEYAWKGTEEASTLTYTQATTSGAVTIPAVFVPLRSGPIAYTITVSDDKGSVLETKTVTNTIAKKKCTWKISSGHLTTGYYESADRDGSRWGYDTYFFGLKVSTNQRLDYVGNGIEVEVPITLDYRYDIQLQGLTGGVYPNDNDPGAIYISCHTATGQHTTQTFRFKNTAQEIVAFPIDGGFGNKYFGAGSYSYKNETIDEVAGIYSWTYSVSYPGIEAKASEFEVIIHGAPQLDLTIEKQVGDWRGIIK